MSLEDENVKSALASLKKSTKKKILLELIKDKNSTYNTIEDLYIRYCLLLSK